MDVYYSYFISFELYILKFHFFIFYFVQLWSKIECEARMYAIHLCEELKSVLEPTQISSYKGDYKSGFLKKKLEKKLLKVSNIKKI